jgi:hypothetical protein
MVHCECVRKSAVNLRYPPQKVWCLAEDGFPIYSEELTLESVPYSTWLKPLSSPCISTQLPNTSRTYEYLIRTYVYSMSNCGSSFRSLPLASLGSTLFYLQTNMCIYIYMCINKYIYINIDIDIYRNIDMDIDMSVCKYVSHMSICIYKYVYSTYDMYIYICIYICIYVYIYMYRCVLPWLTCKTIDPEIEIGDFVRLLHYEWPKSRSSFSSSHHCARSPGSAQQVWRRGLRI